MRIGLWLSVSVVCGCSLPGQRADFDSIDPAERTLAAVAAVESPEPSETRELIEMLESEDPGDRMLAIGVLERSTGERFGFDHAGSARSRREAVERWRRWAESSQAGFSVAGSGGR
jgi:hypothetical protein